MGYYKTPFYFPNAYFGFSMTFHKEKQASNYFFYKKNENKFCHVKISVKFIKRFT